MTKSNPQECTCSGNGNKQDLYCGVHGLIASTPAPEKSAGRELGVFVKALDVHRDLEAEGYSVCKYGSYRDSTINDFVAGWNRCREKELFPEAEAHKQMAAMLEAAKAEIKECDLERNMLVGMWRDKLQTTNSRTEFYIAATNAATDNYNKLREILSFTNIKLATANSRIDNLRAALESVQSVETTPSTTLDNEKEWWYSCSEVDLIVEDAIDADDKLKAGEG